MIHWQPNASIETLKKRANLLMEIRSFFYERNILEVQTPLLSSSAATDVHLDSLTVITAHQKGFLLTSPELPIKRLLCAGMSDCYQISSAFRDSEQGVRHNREFSMLEWYRLNKPVLSLAREVTELIQRVHQKAQILSTTDETSETLKVCELSYQQVFEQYLGIDPLNLTPVQLNQLLQEKNVWEASQAPLSKDDALDLLFSCCIAPEFEHNQLTIVYDYPASQAALARINPANPNVAERFEVFWGALELANGFHELADAQEQRQRFIEDNQARVLAGKAASPMDEYFLSALACGGLPDCSGVALGVDRLMMKALNCASIDQVLCFTSDRI